MKADRFDSVLNDQIERTIEILGSKAGEYANDQDRLHNFKKAAALQGVTPLVALRGMLAKHTVSIFDMLASENNFSLEKWDEKITDSINYHILLRALVVEQDDEDAALGTNATE